MNPFSCISFYLIPNQVSFHILYSLKGNMGRKKKTTQGRKKIAIEKIASEEARYVCFSKRRNGVFTKAADLATLCGAEVVVVVNSPAGNPYSFGSPGVNEVVDRFLSGNVVPSGSSSLHQAHHVNVTQELNLQCMEVSRRIDISNTKKFMLEALLKTLVQKNPLCRLSDEIEGLQLTQLKQVEELLKGLKMRIEGRISELMRGGGALSSNVIMDANPIRRMDQFEFGNGQTYLASHLGYGRGFY